MPTLNKLQKKKHPRHCSDSNKLYNMREYKNLRAAMKIQQPLCLLCQEKGITKVAEHYHHIKPFGWAASLEEQISLLLNPINIIGLCSECHNLVHVEYNKGHYQSMKTKLQTIREKLL